jgi:uncharacterized membrane protein YphA (DoxX/SURF4 family)
MSPVTAAYTGVGIELIGPILLIAGFMTRPAAAAMAALTIVSQAAYVPSTSNLIVIVMVGWSFFARHSGIRLITERS